MIIPIQWRLLNAACFEEAPVARLSQFVQPLAGAVEEFGLGERLRLCCLLANIAHETDSFLALHEYHDGSAYEGRLDLGNTEPGDGRRFPGMGGLMLTGRANHTACARHFGMSLEELAAWLVKPEGAMRSACWYFARLRPECVRAADNANFQRVCAIIGGRKPYGMKSRLARFMDLLGYIDLNAKAFA